MHCFRDKTGQEWPVELTIGAVSRIRGESSGRFDFFDPVKDDLAQTLSEDLPTLWEALWFVCAATARERKVNAEEFGRVLADDVLHDAQAALFNEWRDFFHRIHRENLALMVEKVATFQAKRLQMVKEKLSDPLLTTIDQRVMEKMETELNAEFGKLLVNLDSILGPSPSANSPPCPPLSTSATGR